MSPVSASRKGGTTYRYYVSHVAQRGRLHEAGVHKRIPAPVIETMVCDAVAPLLANAADSEDWLNVRDLIDCVEIHRHEIVVRLDHAASRALSLAMASSGAGSWSETEMSHSCASRFVSIAVAASPWLGPAAVQRSPANRSIRH